jgi:hypothetical protein
MAAKKPTTELVRIAMFDMNMRLIGSREVAAGSVEALSGIDPGDLPLNGTYKYNEERRSFIPLGFGFGKVKTNQPNSTEYVLAMVIDHLTTLAPPETISPEIIDWRAWYAKNMQKRDEELATSAKR